MTDGAATLIVRAGNRVRRAECRAGDTILDALRRAEIDIPTQCEKAYCGSCMFQLVKGEISLRINDVLSAEDLAEGYRLACQGVAATPEVEIELL